MSRSNQLAGLLTADPPTALDTINEINTALGNDASLSTTLTNSIATKASKSGDTFTGNVGIGATPSVNLHIIEDATEGTPSFAGATHFAVQATASSLSLIHISEPTRPY